MAESFNVIIAGGRDFNDYDLLCKKCDIIFSRNRPSCIFVGGARGADLLGERYAIDKSLLYRVFPAQWDLLGKSAGYARNREMLKEADALVAFWDGKSKGTQNMILISQQKGIPVRIVRY